MMGRGARFTTRTYGLLALAAMVASGCFFMRDPLDPLGELDHRAVRELTRAEQAARSRSAYDRARGRIAGVKRGMSAAEVEVVLGAIVIAERHDENEDEAGLPRKKLIDGWLCTTDPSSQRQRWLFGYDDGGVELIGFAIEFERKKPDDEDWVVHGIDRDPEDDCPDVGDEGEPKGEAPR